MVLLFSVIVFGLFPWMRAQSPCPGIFDYHNDGTGVIRLQPSGPVSSITIRANFTIAARLATNYVGRLEPVGQGQALQRYNQGFPLQYVVHFPVTSPLPRLTSLVVNNREICYGPPDIPGPGQYVSMITLQHMLYLPGGPNSVLDPYYSNEYKPQVNGFAEVGGLGGLGGLGGSVPVNTQIYTVNDRDGIKDITYYTFQVNRTQGGRPIRPGQGFFTEQTTQSLYDRRPQHNPDYNYFEEPVTQPPPPQYFPERTTKPPRPPPVYNLYTTERRPPPLPERPPPDYNPYSERPPQPDRPPPDYNPYEPSTEAPQQPPPDRHRETEKPDIPQTPPRLPAGSNIASHGECGVISGGNERVPLIFNGMSYERGDWPWLVAIYKRGVGRLDFICSGTLISHKHVVTAAHCMHQKNSRTSMKDIVVKVGVYNLEEWGDDITQQRTLESAIIHESFNASTLANDILVFTFDRAVEWNVNIRPACLWSGKTDLNRIVGASGVVAGWGRSEMGAGGHGDPRMARIPIVSTAACRASKPEFHKLTSASTICAGDRNGVGPCLGDSGGGLYILESGRWRLRGVVSLSLRPENGDNTCNLNEYVVFTDAAKYLKWIKDIVQSSLF